MPYAISVKDIRRMIRLMRRLENGTFNEEDREEMRRLTARFMFAASAMNYTDGYTLEKDKE